MDKDKIKLNVWKTIAKVTDVMSDVAWNISDMVDTLDGKAKYKYIQLGIAMGQKKIKEEMEEFKEEFKEDE